MLKRKLFPLAIVGLALALTGCANTGDGSRIDDNEHAQGVVTVKYDGKDLDCITWLGSHSEVGLSCDFVKYHNVKKEDAPSPLTPEEQKLLEGLLEKSKASAPR